MKKFLIALIMTSSIVLGACQTGGEVVTTDDGLIIEDVVVGSGDEEAANGNTLEVHYVGTLEDGTQFDSSRDRDQTFKFPLGRGYVIQGWDEGMLGMRVGGIRKLTIPSELAYGEDGIAEAGIPGNATLLFEVELVGMN